LGFIDDDQYLFLFRALVFDKLIDDFYGRGPALFGEKLKFAQDLAEQLIRGIS